jgi:hypothetical protein
VSAKEVLMRHMVMWVLVFFSLSEFPLFNMFLNLKNDITIICKFPRAREHDKSQDIMKYIPLCCEVNNCHNIQETMFVSAYK